ncbi:L,D-transpeptidase [Methylopila sp. Yamaguchi]|uniref:L,D-transpeptidase n=1 Tax=Methylopila sp. Yamaguchi TaxID=1437817 RepID=UPI000CAEA99C|nr:L,D-transpeptidase [Methylopila sp. Yamaguchi]GBD49245.1 ErfK/YbiS/YcfS/YnhG family protein [Methylopila sp. Yamaguchi]
MTSNINRRSFCGVLLGAGALAGCGSISTPGRDVGGGHDPADIARYGARPDELYPLPATDISRVNRKWLRQAVAYDGYETPGTIVIDTQARFLYLVQEGGAALRYGIGVGKEGLAFEGSARVGRKAKWPRWTPTPDMIAREPERYGPYAGGMAPGLDNPLGPRALYLFQGNRDTLFRIHGTTEPLSIGRAVSSGCIRLFSQDIIDLYDRVPTDTPVVVIQDGEIDRRPAPEIAAAPYPAAEGGDYDRWEAEPARW